MQENFTMTPAPIEARDPSKVALRVIVATIIALVSLIELMTTPGMFVAGIDAALIVLAVGYGMGKRKAGDAMAVATLLVCFLSAVAWESLQTSYLGTTTIIWGLLFWGVIYTKPNR